jgi:hypothetical protein
MHEHRHTASHCHCGEPRGNSDHCFECGCEEFEGICDFVADRSIVTRIDYVDNGVQDEYGFFGKVVASSDVSQMDMQDIFDEIEEMKSILGSHVVAIRVERVPAVRS